MAEHTNAQYTEIDLPTRDLYGQDMGTSEGSFMSLIMKGYGDSLGRSSQSYERGVKHHPFDRVKVKSLMLAQEHHSTCIHTKKNATVGLGHLTSEEREARKRLLEGDPLAAIVLQSNMGNISEADKVLNPLCEKTWQETVLDPCEDYWQVGEGYLEVVREKDSQKSKITGVHHVPAEDVELILEDDNYNCHFRVTGQKESGGTRYFAVFGDLDGFKERRGGTIIEEGAPVPGSQQKYTELIQFRQPTSMSRWYGYPDWLAAVASIELVQCLRQWKYDFFNNRGVPEFMLFLLGQKLPPEVWDKILAAMRSNIGRGNSHKSIAVNIDGDLKVQMEKLALDNKGEDTFDKTNETLATSIVTAHRVPPLLAGLLIPGKMAASNELPNSLIAFQTLVVGQAQRIFQQTLASTLGNPELNGGMKLGPEDFEFRRIIDAYSMASVDTMSRMKQTLPEAQSEGRDLSEGVKKSIIARVAKSIAEGQGNDALVGALTDYIKANG